METLYLTNPNKIKKNLPMLRQKLEVKITLKGRKLTLEGTTIQEYEASMIIDAIDFGFQLKDALQLTNESVIIRKLPIKQFTKRRNLKEVRARIIGTEGKTKRTLEQVSGCAVVLKDNTLAIIGPAELIEEATTALKNLIKGSKQANVYRFLERMNTEKKRHTSSP